LNHGDNHTPPFVRFIPQPGPTVVAGERGFISTKGDMMSDGLRERVRAIVAADGAGWPIGGGAERLAIRAAEAEVARVRAEMEERHAKEKAEWEEANMPLRERLGRRIRQVWMEWAAKQPDIADRPDWLDPWEKLPERIQEVDCNLGMAIWGDAFSELSSSIADAELTKQAAIAAALAAEKERVLAVMDSLIKQGWIKGYIALAKEAIYPPAKVTLPAGAYWVRGQSCVLAFPSPFLTDKAADYTAIPPNPYAKAAEPVKCRACGKPLTGTDRVADGCECNSPRGVNHGIVPVYVCTCAVCDPEQTGSVRPSPARKPTLAEWCERNGVPIEGDFVRTITLSRALVKLGEIEGEDK
jgi:hypothetical protein